MNCSTLFPLFLFSVNFAFQFDVLLFVQHFWCTTIEIENSLSSDTRRRQYFCKYTCFFNDNLQLFMVLILFFFAATLSFLFVRSSILLADRLSIHFSHIFTVEGELIDISAVPAL